MLTDWTECKGHQIRVKPKWQLTPEITDFVVECPSRTGRELCLRG